MDLGKALLYVYDNYFYSSLSKADLSKADGNDTRVWWTTLTWGPFALVANNCNSVCKDELVKMHSIEREVCGEVCGYIRNIVFKLLTIPIVTNTLLTTPIVTNALLTTPIVTNALLTTPIVTNTLLTTRFLYRGIIDPDVTICRVINFIVRSTFVTIAL